MIKFLGNIMVLIILWGICFSTCAIRDTPDIEDGKMLDFGYELLQGIYFEKLDSILLFDKYSYDNKIFAVGQKLRYTYKIVRNDSVFTLDLSNDSLVQINIADHSKLKTLELVVEAFSFKNPIIRRALNYNQTLISYNYWNGEDKLLLYESTGVVENAKNVWMHPPRASYFTVLQHCPFPMYIFENRENWNTYDSTFIYAKQKLGNNRFVIKARTNFKNSKQNSFQGIFNPMLGWEKMEFHVAPSTKIIFSLIN